MKPLPYAQQRVLDFVREQVAAGRSFPSTTVIAAHMGWKNAHSATDCLQALRFKGHLSATRKRAKRHGWLYEWSIQNAAC